MFSQEKPENEHADRRCGKPILKGQWSSWSIHIPLQNNLRTGTELRGYIWDTVPKAAVVPVFPLASPLPLVPGVLA